VTYRERRQRLANGKFWHAAFDSGMKRPSLAALEVENHGDTAYEVEKLEIRGTDGKLLDHAKYVVIWKKEATSWRLRRVIWITSVVPSQE